MREKEGSAMFLNRINGKEIYIYIYGMEFIFNRRKDEAIDEKEREKVRVKSNHGTVKIILSCTRISWEREGEEKKAESYYDSLS